MLRSFIDCVCVYVIHIHCRLSEQLYVVCTMYIYLFIITDDIQIRFFEQSPEGDVVWEAYPDLNDLDVHHQVTKNLVLMLNLTFEMTLPCFIVTYCCVLIVRNHWVACVLENDTGTGA